jgi:hypothetical protein
MSCVVASFCHDIPSKNDALLQENQKIEQTKKHVPTYIIVSVTCMEIMRGYYERYKEKKSKGVENVMRKGVSLRKQEYKEDKGE